VTYAYDAMIFARSAHSEQKRKYTGNPYTDHLAEVAGIVAAVADQKMIDTMVSVAWLHDCVEDQGVTISNIKDIFCSEIADGVYFLSDIEEGNREQRKAMSRERLAEAPGWVQTIKCADLISNTSSIVMHDPKFAKVYMQEKKLLIEKLTKADQRLVSMVKKNLADFFN